MKSNITESQLHKMLGLAKRGIENIMYKKYALSVDAGFEVLVENKLFLQLLFPSEGTKYAAQNRKIPHLEKFREQLNKYGISSQQTFKDNGKSIANKIANGTKEILVPKNLNEIYLNTQMFAICGQYIKKLGMMEANCRANFEKFREDFLEMVQDPNKIKQAKRHFDQKPLFRFLNDLVAKLEKEFGTNTINKKRKTLSDSNNSLSKENTKSQKHVKVTHQNTLNTKIGENRDEGSPDSFDDEKMNEDEPITPTESNEEKPSQEKPSQEKPKKPKSVLNYMRPTIASLNNMIMDKAVKAINNEGLFDKSERYNVAKQTWWGAHNVELFMNNFPNPNLSNTKAEQSTACGRIE